MAIAPTQLWWHGWTFAGAKPATNRTDLPVAPAAEQAPCSATQRESGEQNVYCRDKELLKRLFGLSKREYKQIKCGASVSLHRP